MTDLHLVSWNRFPMTDLVIKTIHRNTKRENFRLVVLDNGSSGDTSDQLQALHDNGLIDEYLPLKTNIGLEAARNLMLKNCVSGKRFICVDNDCLPPPPVDGLDWIDRLNDLVDAYEDYAAIACRTQVMIGTGNIFETADYLDEAIVDFPHPGGSLRMMDAKAVFEVGGWDRDSKGRGAEERYICGKLREAGYKTGFAAKVHTLHLFGTRGERETDRWGYDKDWSPAQSGHSDIWHPVLGSGDDVDEVAAYAGDDLARSYFGEEYVNSNR